MARRPVHDRLFRALLRLFPAEFRGDFGDEMSADFQDQRRDAEARPRALRHLWFRTAADMLRRAPREHLDVLRRDAVYAIRVLRRHPAASATAILSLAIGIGLNSAVYSVVSGVLWRGLPLAESDRLVMIGPVTPNGREPGAISASLFLDLRRDARSFEAVAAGALTPLTIVEPGEPGEVSCLAVTREFFDALRVRPALGRGFTPADYDAALATRGGADTAPPTPAVIVLSDRLWRQRFGANRSVADTEVRVAGGGRIQVAGVMPPEVDAALQRAVPGECWVPDVPVAGEGMWRARIVIGRLAPGRSLAAANAELGVLGGKLEPDWFTKEPQTLQALGMLDRIVGRVQTQLIFLFGAVICVLLVTCANVVNLFLAHAAGRRDELAMRVALGASRMRLVRQLLTESLVISLLGGTLGYLLAVWAVPVLISLAPPEIPRLQQIAVDWSTFTFTLAVAVIIGIVCGIIASIPARHAPKSVSGAAKTTPRANRFRQGVAVCEIALALMLAVAGTLMVRTVRALNAIDLGFDATAVVSADLASTVDDMRETQDQQTAIVERVKTLPGVRAAGIGIGPLSGGMFIGGLVVPGNPRPFDMVRVDAVSPGYFEALGARLKAGRFFEPDDATRAAATRVVVNESAARAFWGDANPIGKTLVITDSDRPQVIGVIADIRGGSLERDPGPTVYQLSHQSRNFLAGNMLIRTDGDPDALAAQVRAVIRSINKEQPFRGVQPLQQRIDQAMAPRLFVLRLIGLFSTLGLLLAVIGVYGVLAEFVSHRVPEFGVRMACGATAANVLGLVLAQGTRLVAIGLALGLGAAVILRDVMSTMVYGVRTFDPLAYSTACVLMFAAAVAACALPARRASRLDPVVALRSE